MSDERDLDGGGTVDDAAIRWFARLQDHAATPDDWATFEAWFAAAPEHAAAYEQLEKIWVDVEAPEVEAALAPAPVVAFRPRPSVSRRVWLIGAGAVAASVTAVVVGVGVLRPPPGETYATGPGETRLLVLADGTRMRLNAQTRAVVRLGRDERRVELADGEAAFDVTHDPARPFVVDVGDRDVRVVGTEFNLRRRDGNVTLNVRRGLVEVRPDAASEQTVRVPAGHQFIHHEGKPGGALSATAPDGAFAWAEGRLVYRDAPMSRVAEDLTRALGTPVRVADPATAQIRFSGVLTLDSPATVLRRLEAYAPVRAEHEAGGVVLHKRK